MNYKKIYNSIIEKRKTCTFEGYGENHHIIPYCISRNDNKENLVRLTAREHFVCHLLLTKIYKDDKKILPKMVRAFIQMLVSSKTQERYKSSRKYEILRKQFAEFQSISQSGDGNSQFGKCWIYSVSEQKSISIKAEEVVSYQEQGWTLGRKFIFDDKQSKVKTFVSERKERTQRKLEERVLEYTRYYRIYKDVGFDGLVQQTGYSKTKQNLVQGFNKYVKDFVPQNGKRRGKVF